MAFRSLWLNHPNIPVHAMKKVVRMYLPLCPARGTYYVGLPLSFHPTPWELNWLRRLMLTFTSAEVRCLATIFVSKQVVHERRQWCRRGLPCRKHHWCISLLESLDTLSTAKTSRRSLRDSGDGLGENSSLVYGTCARGNRATLPDLPAAIGANALPNIPITLWQSPSLRHMQVLFGPLICGADIRLDEVRVVP